MNQNKVLSVRNLVLIAMFSALAAVLETIQVAVPFAPPFYKLDFAELPVLIGGFAMGPAQAALIAIVKNLSSSWCCAWPLVIRKDRIMSMKRTLL